jgi:hypothetical protein
VRRVKARFLSGRQSHPARVAPAGSNRSDEGGDEIVEAYDGKGHLVTPSRRLLRLAKEAEPPRSATLAA